MFTKAHKYKYLTRKCVLFGLFEHMLNILARQKMIQSRQNRTFEGKKKGNTFKNKCQHVNIKNSIYVLRPKAGNA